VPDKPSTGVDEEALMKDIQVQFYDFIHLTILLL